MEKLKKPDLAALAEREVSTKGWLPELLRPSTPESRPATRSRIAETRPWRQLHVRDRRHVTEPYYVFTIPVMTRTHHTPAPENRLVWYAGYGSNLLRERFECYIKGGKPKGSTNDYAGCRDKSDPHGDQPIKLQNALYFADHSSAWDGAVAFIRSGASGATTYARMYLVTYGQFNDVVRQENGRKVPGEVIVPSYDDLARSNEWQIARLRLYGRLMKVGSRDEHPILTFSTSRDDFTIGAPSEAYVKMIVSGLQETYPCLQKSEILDYLAQAEGIRGVIPDDTLACWI
jgi:hypothetical protein